MKKLYILLFALLTLTSFPAQAENPKREFRGAWLHTVGQTHFTQRNREDNKAYLRNQLDSLKLAGINAVIFQVRPCADAFYYSEIEPWSKYLTGAIGDSPVEFWDPLQFMVEECHARGMEIHAWLNPYRSVPVDEIVPPNHDTKINPQRYVVFNKRYFFDPGLAENRDFISKIVADIVTRYNVDAIHMDDYFYPYPVKKLKFPDDKSYARHGNGMTRGDWRRHNVNLLIEQLGETIRTIKPWVRFGISPFGIWRNASSDKRGSDTNGLQNYDDLYADVILWAKEGWIDYQVPQLYWELDHRLASSRKLAPWWDANAFGRHMYFGQDVVKTMDYSELNEKVDISRRLKNVQGNVWWPSVELTRNYKGSTDSLRHGKQAEIALTPEYPWLDVSGRKIDTKAPKDLKVRNGELSWKYGKHDSKNSTTEPAGIVIYKIESPFYPEDMDNPANIIAVYRGENLNFKLSDIADPGTWIFITQLDRLNRESEPSEPVMIE